MKKILQMATAIVAMLCLSASLYAGPTSNNYYFIQAKASQKSLSNQASKNAKTPIVQKAGSQDSQRWRFVSAGGGYYYIISKHSGLYLDVKGASKDKGTIVWQYRRNATAAQKWKLIDAGGGYYYIQSNVSGLYLDVQGASTKDGATIWQYPLNRTDAQKWKLIDAGSVSNINRAKMASMYGPTIKTVKIFTHEFNFGKSISVQKSGSGKVVKGRFSHHKSLRDDDEYYFTATFDAKGEMTKFERKIDEGWSYVAPVLKFLGNELIGKVPVVGGYVSISDSDVDYLLRQAGEKLGGRTSWEGAADRIAGILAVAALDM